MSERAEEEYELNSLSTSTDVAALSELVKQFQSGGIKQYQLWSKLEDLVNKGELSRIDRRGIFWAAHSGAGKLALREFCCYFDPHDELWEYGNAQCSPATEERAECRLRSSIHILHMKDDVAHLHSVLFSIGKWAGISWCVDAVLSIVYLGGLFFITSSKNDVYFILFGLQSLFIGTWASLAVAHSYLSDSIKSMDEGCKELQESLLYPV